MTSVLMVTDLDLQDVLRLRSHDLGVNVNGPGTVRSLRIVRPGTVRSSAIVRPGNVQVIKY